MDAISAVVRGNIVDFDAFEKLVEKTFDELRLKPEEAGMPVRPRESTAPCFAHRLTHIGLPGTWQVLITESPLTSKENREKVAQLMFETFKVPGLCMANSAVMSLFCSGRTRGVTVRERA